MPFHADIVVPLLLVAAATLADLRRREIPDVIPVLLLAWALVGVVFGRDAGALAQGGFGLLEGFAAGALLFRLGGLGGGDVKLLAALGAVLGPVGLILALRWIAIAGGVFALLALRGGKREIAYAPAIGVGLAVHLLIALGTSSGVAVA